MRRDRKNEGKDEFPKPVLLRYDTKDERVNTTWTMAMTHIYIESSQVSSRIGSEKANSWNSWEKFKIGVRRDASPREKGRENHDSRALWGAITTRRKIEKS